MKNDEKYVNNQVS